jgi:hypothetical protein
VKGAIGHNTTKRTATITIADATDTNGDVAKWEGKVFPKYIGRGTTFLYAVAINQSSPTIKMIDVQGGRPVLQFVVTDAEGLPGKTCGAAVLGFRGRKAVWTALPATGRVKGSKVTITQYNAPSGFELPPKTARFPIYFAVNCYS